MYYFTGSNLFGQWFNSNNISSKFEEILFPKHLASCAVELCGITWSQVIFSVNKKFYIIGSWLGIKNCITEVKLPKECSFSQTLFLVANDYNLYLINNQTNDLWILEFNKYSDWNWQHKTIQLNIENSLNVENAHKKLKVDNIIKKVVATNTSLLLLTIHGSVFQLPNKIRTDKCNGKVCDIDFGYEHGVLLTENGYVYTWGNGRRCQLGHGDLHNLDEPKEVESLAGIKISQIKAGGWHTLAVSESGDLYCWGWNDCGQLGILDDENTDAKSKTSYAIPTLVDFKNCNVDVVVKDVACGSRHSAVLLNDYTVWTSGHNKHGQLGFCPTETPSKVIFTKAFNCIGDIKLLCGPWCTVIMSV